MKQPLISVVVPIYNVEQYLQKCIDSIVAQTYINVEILLINDGSTDSSGDLCDRAARKDNRIKVIHKKNGGLSDARNVGLNQSTGSLVCFIDSDDYIKKNYLNTMYETKKKTGADIVVCGFYRVSGKILSKASCSPESLSGLEAIQRLLVSKDICEVMACNKLYDKRLFRSYKIMYPTGKISEDVFTTYRLFEKSKKVVFIEELLYYYVKRQTSITNVGHSRKNLDAIEGADRIIEWARKNQPNLLSAAYAFRVREVMFVVDKIYNQAKQKDVMTLYVFTRWIRSNWRVVFLNNDISVRKKLTLLMLMIGGRVYANTRALYEHLSEIRNIHFKFSSLSPIKVCNNKIKEH